jgi:hypothetical protein
MAWYNPFSWGGSDNSMEDVQGYLSQMGPMLEEQYGPYRQAGMEALPTLQNQYAMLLQNPQAMQALLGGGYEKSPGYQFQYDEAMNAANQAAAAGGLLGTSGHQRQAAGLAQGLANQDYWNSYGANERLFGQGLAGTQGLFGTGFDATNQLASGLGSMYGNQANLAYSNMQSQNDMLASLLGAGIGAAGYALGGPVGGMAGNAAGKALGGWMK